MLCLSRHVYTKQMKVGPQNKMGGQLVCKLIGRASFPAQTWSCWLVRQLQFATRHSSIRPSSLCPCCMQHPTRRSASCWGLHLTQHGCRCCWAAWVMPGSIGLVGAQPLPCCRPKHQPTASLPSGVCARDEGGALGLCLLLKCCSYTPVKRLMALWPLPRQQERFLIAIQLCCCKENSMQVA